MKLLISLLALATLASAAWTTAESSEGNPVPVNATDNAFQTSAPATAKVDFFEAHPEAILLLALFIFFILAKRRRNYE